MTGSNLDADVPHVAASAAMTRSQCEPGECLVEEHGFVGCVIVASPPAVGACNHALAKAVATARR